MRAAWGRIYVGANIENVSYPIGACTEEAALAAGETEVIEAYVVAVAPEPVPQCGACRKRFKEFGKDDVVVWMGTTDGKEDATRIGDLLPGAFDAG